MATTGESNAELELRALTVHELDLVSGGMAPAVSASVQDLGIDGRRADNTYGANSLYGEVYEKVVFPDKFK